MIDAKVVVIARTILYDIYLRLTHKLGVAILARQEPVAPRCATLLEGFIVTVHLAWGVGRATAKRSPTCERTERQRRGSGGSAATGRTTTDQGMGPNQDRIRPILEF